MESSWTQNNWKTKFSMSEAADYTGLSQEAIRNYSEEFKKVLGRVETNRKGNRCYTLDQVRKLESIRKWRDAPRVEQFVKSEFAK